MSGKVIEEVIVHPLVLLASVDHYYRVAKGTKRRVIGCLLGEFYKGRLDISNSFAIPFEEEAKTDLWFLDFNYLESMRDMFRKINQKEAVVGFYSSGREVQKCDIDIAL